MISLKQMLGQSLKKKLPLPLRHHHHHLHHLLCLEGRQLRRPLPSHRPHLLHPLLKLPPTREL